MTLKCESLRTTDIMDDLNTSLRVFPLDDCYDLIQCNAGTSMSGFNEGTSKLHVRIVKLCIPRIKKTTGVLTSLSSENHQSYIECHCISHVR